MPRDKQEEAIAACTRALSHASGLDVTYQYQNNEDFLYDGMKLRLPHLSDVPNGKELTIARGIADAAALHILHHNPETHTRYAPASEAAKAIYDAAESVRVEALGVLEYDGIRHNLAAREDARSVLAGYDRFTEGDDLPVADIIRFLVREQLTALPAPEAASSMMQKFGKALALRIARPLTELAQHLENQEAFAKTMRRLIEQLDTGEAQEITSDETVEGDEQQENEQDENNEQEQEGDENDAESQHTGEQRSGGELPQGKRPVKAKLGALSDEGERDEMGESIDGERYLPNWDSHSEDIFRYKAFTTQFDEVIPADQLCSQEELIRLRNQLDRKLSEIQDITRKLAQKLQRKLMAQQQRSWEFAKEEGMLDAARLSTLIADPTYPYPFKIEREVEHVDTVVTLLLDNSGSMRGRPITVAALSADVLARTLERCGIKVEILGFTSRDWKGGDSKKLWEAQGKPLNPGRLNDLRHIIYKSADQPWRRARKNLGLMLRDGILKENIDGEAILWAHDRLLARPEKRMILMVISDGAPVDDSTLSNNSAHYLDRHLREVIATIETRSPVELLAIGIGHDVTRYYKRAVTIRDVDQLGDTMFGQLTELFDEKVKKVG
jgi:cobaltochelatase CobT